MVNDLGDLFVTIEIIFVTIKMFPGVGVQRNVSSLHQ